MKQQGGQQPAPKPRWPGPVAGPGWPGQQGDWPQWPQPRPQNPPPWPQQPQQPQPAPFTGEAPSVEGQPTEGYGSIETDRLEGSSLVTGSVAEERARFRGQSEQFRRARPETALHHPQEEREEAVAEVHPVLQVLRSQQGLAQAVLLAEVLGRPRALRPYGKR